MASPPAVAAALGFSLLVAPVAAFATPEEDPCEVSPRLEIFNDAVEDYYDLDGLEAPVGCDVGPWRTFGIDDWVLSDADWDFIEQVALQAVPEPFALTGSLAALGALGALALRGRRRARRGAPPSS